MMLTNGSDEERSNKYLAIPTAETQNILVSEFDIGVWIFIKHFLINLKLIMLEIIYDYEFIVDVLYTACILM